MTSEAALPGGASASLPRLWQNFKSSFTGIGAIRDTVQPGANDAREFSLNAARGTRRDQEYADFLRSNPMALFQLLGRGQSIARASYAKSEFETMFNQTRDLELAKLQFGDASSGSARFNREFGNERTISQYNQNTAAIKDLKSAQADLNDALLNGAEYQARVNRQFEAGRVREYAGAIEDYRNVQRELNESNSERFSQIENLRAETDYLREQINLKRENVRLEQELFRVGVITKDEERNATLQAQLDILRRDRDATLSMIRSRAEIADASIYHSQQSTAIVLEHLAKQKSMSEAVADAQITLYEGVAGSLDRGIDKLTKKLGFFGDAIGSILKTITRNVLTGLFMPFLGGGGFGAPQQRGGFNPLSILGSVLGGGGAAGIGGTGGFAGGYGGAGIAGINTLFNVFSQNGGGYGAFGSANGLGNAMGIIGGLAGLFKGGSGGAANVVSGGESFGLPTNFGGGLGGVFAPVTNKLGGLFSKIGLGGIFGKSSAATGPFAGAVASGSATGGGGFLAGFLPQLGLAAPLLGLSLGAGLGGQSRIGNILGGAGGLLVGGGIAAALAPGLFAGLGSAAPLVTGLLANPFTAVVGVGLLVGAKLLGNAKQRKKDEEATGDWLQDAINGIFKLRDQVKAGQTSPDQAKTLFENDILGTFIAQVNTIKTKSVRESRLTNQVRDLRNLYEKEVGTVAVQKKISSSLSNKLVPEFATGGIVPGQNGEPRLVLAHGGEIIINQRQQTSGLIRAAGEAGVPGVAPTRGVASSGERPISLTVTLVAGTDTQSKMFINGVQSKDGFNEVIETLREINRNGDMRSIRKR